MVKATQMKGAYVKFLIKDSICCSQRKLFQCKGELLHSIHKMERLDTNKERIEKRLKAVDRNKTSGPDEISCWVLKECVEELSVPRKIISKDSVRQRKLPECWKWANILPLYKKGNKQDRLNYRSVSLTSVMCKFLERRNGLNIWKEISQYNKRNLDLEKEGFVLQFC